VDKETIKQHFTVDDIIENLQNFQKKANTKLYISHLNLKLKCFDQTLKVHGVNSQIRKKVKNDKIN
jgi:hypothetical protein